MMGGSVLARWLKPRPPTTSADVTKALDDQLQAIEAAWPAGHPTGDGQTQRDTYIELREKRARWLVRREIAEHVLFVVEHLAIMATIIAMAIEAGH